ncbi:S8 family serine peptidase [Candidatus Halocynthiibacter alkanivorans]|uniref:S8 family serine peptidase n=1 Tax=Candidatus Halocynthiibacter alkanivorans TaxID=2267619 RepID=UPI00135BD614|nr:S8 family serine peptidase [Candidatus Halocynthiibacter alkanivorans]
MKIVDEMPEQSKYYYLWHLVSLGVISCDSQGINVSDTLWDRINEKGKQLPSTVVLIDVGCSFSHPNLIGRVDADRSIDFTGTPFGARLVRGDQERVSDKAQYFADLDISGISLEELSARDNALFQEIVRYLIASRGEARGHGDVEGLFASHGTAVSGLIVGGPEICNDSEKQPTPGVLPYFGVDPFSRLVSVRTGFDNDPLQFVAALLYAWAQSPDVIVLPRGLPDPDASAISPKEDFKAELESWSNHEAADLLHRIDVLSENTSEIDTASAQHSITGQRLWRVVRSLFIAISKHIPIVCAAGNDGESQLNYPASLANRENGIIAVGALSANGYRAGYSNYGEGLTLVAPSDDMEVFNRHQLRGTKSQLKKSDYLMPVDAQQISYSQKALLSTDIAGAFGYDTGGLSADDHWNGADKTEKVGLYTQFGGTSGACALVGGVIALIRRAERSSATHGTLRDSCDIKGLLASTARRTMPTMQGDISLKTDSMNSDGEEAETFENFFGSGLVDAEAAISQILG